MPKVTTIEDVDVIKAANNVRDANQITNVAGENLKNLKKVLVDHILDDFYESVEDCDGITNFKINCTSVVKGKDPAPDGVVIQVQMRLGSDEIKDEEMSGKLVSILGDSFNKLFEEVKVYEDITDLPALISSINPDLIKKTAKVNPKGAIEIKIADFIPGLLGVKTRTVIVPKASLLDKIRTHKSKLSAAGVAVLKEFIESVTTPVVVVGNKPEAS